MRVRTLCFLAAAGLGALLVCSRVVQRGRAQQEIAFQAQRAARRNIERERLVAVERSHRETRPAESSPETPRLRDLGWKLSPPPGFHDGPVQVSLASTKEDDLEVRYTLDGTEPRPTSSRLEGPVGVDQTTVIRAAGFAGGQRVTQIASASYFIEARPPLPVFSISMVPEDFQTVHLSSQARGRESEYPAYLEIFAADGERLAATGFGMRLHGGAGRQGNLRAKKAYRIYFRRGYGKAKLKAPLFPGSPVQEFDALVLRSGYNDRFRPGRGEYNVRAAYLRDQVLRDLHRDMGCPAVRGAWCLLYVNGETRGLYNVVERPGDEFLAAHLGGGEWDVMKTGDEAQSGSSDEWFSLLAAVGRAAPDDPASFEELRRRIDLDNFASYMVLNYWAQNHDWSFNNWYAARRRAADARWIFMSWDAEWGMGLRPSGWQADTFTYHVTQRSSIRDIQVALLGHREYRAHFLRKTKEHLAGALSTENVLAHFTRQREAIKPVMEEELRRFSGRYSMDDWADNLADMEKFARERGEAFRRLMEVRLAEPFRMPGGYWQGIDSPVFVPPEGAAGLEGLRTRGLRLGPAQPPAPAQPTEPRPARPRTDVLRPVR